MKLPRRRFLQLAGGAVALPALSRTAHAETYPTRPVRWIVSFAAGGSNDTTARVIAQSLSDHLGQQVFVENRTGAGGNVGMEAALRATPRFAALCVQVSEALQRASLAGAPA